MPNRATTEVREFCASIVEDPIYQRSVRERALRGLLSPALETLIWHYRWGKPKEEVQVEQQVIYKWLD